MRKIELWAYAALLALFPILFANLVTQAPPPVFPQLLLFAVFTLVFRAALAGKSK